MCVFEVGNTHILHPKASIEKEKNACFDVLAFCAFYFAVPYFRVVGGLLRLEDGVERGDNGRGSAKGDWKGGGHEH